MPQVKLATDVAESAAKAQKSGTSWGMCTNVVIVEHAICWYVGSTSKSHGDELHVAGRRAQGQKTKSFRYSPMSPDTQDLYLQIEMNEGGKQQRYGLPVTRGEHEVITRIAKVSPSVGALSGPVMR